jgi:hypothetical protein
MQTCSFFSRDSRDSRDNPISIAVRRVPSRKTRVGTVGTPLHLLASHVPPVEGGGFKPNVYGHVPSVPSCPD